ncbi:sugar transferase [Geomonas sp. Red32]|uniref:sugar transferase n=1 Tax=Geomonas sp. Red32 TaxID=2912856 RepID=UPI00202CC9FD|nr:sugar transferase [Geomonas sp. Red32]MCM0083833.1 sugar transferase [Geomonas sp. Red32]
MKGAFNTIVAGTALLLFAPLLVLVALLILLDDGGPVLFVQERLGKRMVPFSIYKFRSMRDGRVTRVGRWIRVTGIDELLQFINVLKGEMAIVGPRPMTRDDVDRLGWGGPDLDRWRSEPGLTGVAQLFAGKGRRVSRFLDGCHAGRWSLWLDIQVIVLSFLVNCVGKHRVRNTLSRWRNWRRKTKRLTYRLKGKRNGERPNDYGRLTLSGRGG